MRIQHLNRTAAAGAVAALLATGAGLAAIGTGAIALGGGTAGDALIQVKPGSHTVVFQPTQDDLAKAAYDAKTDDAICSSDDWLKNGSACATQLQQCATKYVKSTVAVEAAFDVNGYLYSCRPQP